MRKMILSLAVLVLMTASVQAGPSLGSWDEGAAGTTHQYWDFTTGYVTPITGGLGAVPETVVNPQADQVVLQIAPLSGSLTWDVGTDSIYGSDILLDAKIPNYPNINPVKEIWVDVGLAQGVLAGQPLSVIVPGGYSYELLQGPGPNPQMPADFGFRIMPNPSFEDILFRVQGLVTGAPAVLGYVHIDTICVPAPGAILLGSLGVGLVGWLRRRRTL